jgi:hypothetical protein
LAVFVWSPHTTVQDVVQWLPWIFFLVPLSTWNKIYLFKIKRLNSTMKMVTLLNQALIWYRRLHFHKNCVWFISIGVNADMSAPIIFCFATTRVLKHCG